MNLNQRYTFRAICRPSFNKTEQTAMSVEYTAGALPTTPEDLKKVSDQTNKLKETIQRLRQSLRAACPDTMDEARRQEEKSPRRKRMPYMVAFFTKARELHKELARHEQLALSTGEIHEDVRAAFLAFQARTNNRFFDEIASWPKAWGLTHIWTRYWACRDLYYKMLEAGQVLQDSKRAANVVGPSKMAGERLPATNRRDYVKSEGNSFNSNTGADSTHPFSSQKTQTQTSADRAALEIVTQVKSEEQDVQASDNVGSSSMAVTEASRNKASYAAHQMSMGNEEDNKMRSLHPLGSMALK